jgi:hypothetical protein
MAWTCQLAGVQALLQCCSPEKRTMPWHIPVERLETTQLNTKVSNMTKKTR